MLDRIGSAYRDNPELAFTAVLLGGMLASLLMFVVASVAESPVAHINACSRACVPSSVARVTKDECVCREAAR